MTTTLQASEAPAVPTESGAAPPRSRARAPRYRSDPSPWRRSDALVPGVLALLGTAVLIGCWVGASGERAWRDQIGWLVGASIGTGVVVLGGALWLLVGFRSVRRGFRDLRTDQRRVLDLPVGRADAADSTSPVQTATYVTAAAMTRAHRPDCLLMRGKFATAVAPADLGRYERCGVCRS